MGFWTGFSPGAAAKTTPSPPPSGGGSGSSGGFWSGYDAHVAANKPAPPSPIEQHVINSFMSLPQTERNLTYTRLQSAANNGDQGAARKLQLLQPKLNQNAPQEQTFSPAPTFSNKIINAASDWATQNIGRPIQRGEQALTNLQNKGQLGESGKQFASDVINTGLNAAPGLKGIKLLEGANLGSKIARGAVGGAAIGGIGSGVSAFGAGAKPGEIAKATGEGTVAGALFGTGGAVAGHAAGAAAKTVARFISNPIERVARLRVQGAQPGLTGNDLKTAVATEVENIKADSAQKQAIAAAYHQGGVKGLTAATGITDAHLNPDNPNYKTNLVHYVNGNYEQLKQQYLAKHATPDQVTLNADNWRELLPGYRGTNSADTVPAANTLNKRLFNETLEAQKGKGNNTVLVMAGGGGSGKGTASGQFGDALKHSEYPIVFDGTTANYDKFFNNIHGPATKAGYNTQVLFVDRNPQAAAGGIIDRAMNARGRGEVARTVPLDVGMQDNIGARNAYVKLLQEDPDMARGVIDNNHPVGDAVLYEDPKQALDYLTSKSYNIDETRKAVANDLQARKDLPADIRAGLVPQGSETDRHLQLQRASEGSPGGTQAERPPATATSGTKPNSEPAGSAASQVGDLYAQGAIGHDVPSAPGVVQNRFTEGVRNSPDVSPTVKSEVEGEHTVRSTQGLVEHADAYINKFGLDKSIETAHEALDQPLGHIDDQTVAAGIKVAHAADVAGRTDDATRIYDALSAHLTKAGQTIQAASLLYRRTPQGLMSTAEKALKAAGVKVEGELKTKVDGLVDALKQAPEGSQEYYAGVQKLAKLVNTNLPTGKLDKLFTLWRTGLLTGPQTVTKVIASHGVLNALEAAKTPIETGLDKIISKISGFRSTVATTRGIVSGAKAGAKAAGNLLATGIDTQNTGAFAGMRTKLGVAQANYNTGITKGPIGKFLNAYVQRVTDVHAAAPKAFYRSAYENDLNKQAIAEAVNQKLSGNAREQFIKDFVSKPSDAAKAEAEHAAQMATFQQETRAGGAAATLQHVPGGRVLTPFAHIASAILTDAANYSPVGAAKTVIEALRDNKASGWTPQIQKHFVEGLGRSIVGTGILGTGYALYKAGVMTLDYPKDPKTAAQWKTLGKQPNSVLINGKWRQLSSLGPAAIVLAMGGYAASGTGGGKGNVALSAVAGALKSLSDQSFLSGLTGAAGAINNPELSAKSFAKNEASSVVPIGVGTIAKALDPFQRQTNSIMDAVKSKIPGVREGLPVSQDANGKPLQREGSVATNLFDPTRPTSSYANASPVNQELQRLSTQGVIVSPQVVKSITVKGTKVPLTPAQQATRQQAVGSALQSELSKIINTPDYKSLSAANQGTTLGKAITDINRAEDAKLVKQLRPDLGAEAYKGLTKAQKDIYNSGSNSKDYTKPPKARK